MIKVGTLFAGRYGVIQQIGTGGMAEVFKAQDVVENRIVALKVMKDSLATDEAAARESTHANQYRRGPGRVVRRIAASTYTS